MVKLKENVMKNLTKNIGMSSKYNTFGIVPISGGVDMYYQSTLVYQLGKKLLRNSERRKKIKKLFNL